MEQQVIRFIPLFAVPGVGEDGFELSLLRPLSLSHCRQALAEMLNLPDSFIRLCLPKESLSSEYPSVIRFRLVASLRSLAFEYTDLLRRLQLVVDTILPSLVHRARFHFGSNQDIGGLLQQAGTECPLCTRQMQEQGVKSESWTCSGDRCSTRVFNEANALPSTRYACPACPSSNLCYPCSLALTSKLVRDVQCWQERRIHSEEIDFSLYFTDSDRIRDILSRGDFQSSCRVIEALSKDFWLYRTCRDALLDLIKQCPVCHGDVISEEEEEEGSSSTTVCDPENLALHGCSHSCRDVSWRKFLCCATCRQFRVCRRCYERPIKGIAPAFAKEQIAALMNECFKALIQRSENQEPQEWNRETYDGFVQIRFGKNVASSTISVHCNDRIIQLKRRLAEELKLDPCDFVLSVNDLTLELTIQVMNYQSLKEFLPEWGDTSKQPLISMEIAPYLIPPSSSFASEREIVWVSAIDDDSLPVDNLPSYLILKHFDDIQAAMDYVFYGRERIVAIVTNPMIEEGSSLPEGVDLAKFVQIRLSSPLPLLVLHGTDSQKLADRAGFDLLVNEEPSVVLESVLSVLGRRQATEIAESSMTEIESWSSSSSALLSHEQDDDEEEPGEELTCPITMDLFEDPVILAESGLTYSRAAIESWLETHPYDPFTRQQLVSKQLVPNYAVQQLVDEWKKGHGGSQLASVPASEEITESEPSSTVSTVDDSWMKSSSDVEFSSADAPSDELLCPITMELLEDPVIVVETGQTYSRAAIEHWFESNSTDPFTGAEISKQLIPNGALRRVVDAWREEHDLKEVVNSSPSSPVIEVQTTEETVSHGELMRQFLRKIHLTNYIDVFESEAIEFSRFPTFVNHEDLEELIPLPIPRKRFECYVSAVFDCVKNDDYAVTIAALDELGVENADHHELVQFLLSSGLDGFTDSFQEKEVVYADLSFITSDRTLMKQLIPRMGPRRGFRLAVESLHLPDPRTLSPLSPGSGSSPLRLWLKSSVSPNPGMKVPWDSVSSVREIFAKGAFGVLRRGHYGGMDIVVKDLLLETQAHYEMAVEEFQHLLEFQHDLVVRVYGYSIKEGEIPIFRIIMESMKKNLQQMIREPIAKFSIYQKFRVLWQCGKVLHFLHSERVTLHRDVKAVNFLVSGDISPLNFHPIIKIGDFGLAKRKQSIQSETMTSRRGTLLWMSPESLGRDVRIGFPSDIYSFACTIYEVLYECFPFRSRDDPLRGRITDNNLGVVIQGPSGARPCLAKLQEFCPEFADLIACLWQRPVDPNFDSMEKVLSWFEECDEVMRERYSRTEFHDKIGSLRVDQIQKSEFDEVFPTNDV